ncbi:MAG: hypothetical protein RLZZ505_543 [Verrucomicrobiota bacterium]|jgi:mitochondrial fission protein ELM1
MGDVLRILVISDGKAGHENQSLGLAEALARLRPAEIHTLRLDMKKSFFFRLRAAVAEGTALPRPHWVIAAGHATHPAAILIARRCGARSISLMRPSLPIRWFDLCICPEHDFMGKAVPRNAITTKGALNRVLPGTGKRSGNMFLIGGPSRTHGWDAVALAAQIRRIAGDDSWQAADSRRTPEGFLGELKKELPALEIYPHQQTQPGWLAGKLSTLETVWVTEDSVSMIYEALSSGAKTGVLAMPRIKPDARVIRGLEALRAEGFFDTDGTPRTLAEADRCAGILLKEFG